MVTRAAVGALLDDWSDKMQTVEACRTLVLRRLEQDEADELAAYVLVLTAE